MNNHGYARALAGLLSIAATGSPRAQEMTAPDVSLVGSWTLVAADVIHKDGSRSQDYGPAPRGLLMIDPHGNYTLQIYSNERAKFASGDKLKGTPAEYQQAILGASTHFGTISVDARSHEFTLNVEKSTYPNQESLSQKRQFELTDDVLSYRVATRPNGDTPVSVWRRIK